MGEADFPGARDAPAADEAAVGNRVVRCSEGTDGQEAAVGR